ncbi:unnamed protein product [Peniophora sp. CBMAI 1063]|nr:unnamed protein product [Peniophora sp. CBMAI 1063]
MPVYFGYQQKNTPFRRLPSQHGHTRTRSCIRVPWLARYALWRVRWTRSGSVGWRSGHVATTAGAVEYAFKNSPSDWQGSRSFLRGTP